MGIQPEKKRTRRDHIGESVFPGTDPFSLFFRFAYTLFVIHRNRIQSHTGVSRPDPYQNQVLYTDVYEGLKGFTSSSGHEAC